MKPLRILVVDDEAPARHRLLELLGDGRDEVASEVVGEAANGMQALERVNRGGVDVALVDIHMPGMSGMELARHLHALEHPPAVIFVTAHDRYAVEAFELNAIDYLLKPVRLARLVAALRKAASGVQAGRDALARADAEPRRHLSAVERGRVTLVPVAEVLFLRAGQKYVSVHTREREFLIEEPLSALEKEFEGVFIRIHRNCLVARRLIRGVERASGDESDAGWSVILEGASEKLQVSRRQWGAIRDLLKA